MGGVGEVGGVRVSSVERRSEFSNHAALRALPTVCSCRQQDSSEGPTLAVHFARPALSGASSVKAAAPSALLLFHKLPLHNRSSVKQDASIGANVAKLLCGLIEFSQVGVCECIRAADTQGSRCRRALSHTAADGESLTAIEHQQHIITAANSAHNNIPPIKP